MKGVYMAVMSCFLPCSKELSLCLDGVCLARVQFGGETDRRDIIAAGRLPSGIHHIVWRPRKRVCGAVQ